MAFLGLVSKCFLRVLREHQSLWYCFFMCFRKARFLSTQESHLYLRPCQSFLLGWKPGPTLVRCFEDPRPAGKSCGWHKSCMCSTLPTSKLSPKVVAGAYAGAKASTQPNWMCKRGKVIASCGLTALQTTTWSPSTSHGIPRRYSCVSLRNS
jgi:hypothetical protein